MIIMENSDVSRFYASHCIQSWESAFPSLKIKRFSAQTPDSIKDRKELRFYEKNLSSKYVMEDISVEITPSERACWYSHFDLWNVCAFEENRPILILEHDAFLFDPKKFWIDLDSYHMIFYDKAAMGAYILTPDIAANLILLAKRMRIFCGIMSEIRDWYFRGLLALPSSTTTTKFRKGIYSVFSASNENQFIPCVNQIYSRKLGNTIQHGHEHFKDIEWKEHDFIYIQ